MYSEKLVLPESYKKREREEARREAIKEYDESKKCCPVCGSDEIEETCMTHLFPFYNNNKANCRNCNWDGIVHELVPEKFTERFYSG